MGKIYAEVLISGRVQMVGFRYFIKLRAALLGVAGAIENLPDGRVKAVFEGEQQKVEKIIQLCRKGPPTAKVTEVRVTYSGPKNLNGFKIKGAGFLGR